MLMLVARDGSAQRVEPAGVTHRKLNASERRDSLPPFNPTTRVAIRVLTGAAGFVAGAAVGVGIAGVTGPHDCGCDDGDLDAAISGVILGGVAGAAIGAALPKLGANCSGNARFWRALGGSVAGFAVGFVAIPLGPILLSPVGAGLALAGC